MSSHPKSAYDANDVVMQRCLMCGYRRAKAPSSYYQCCHIPMRDEADLAYWP